MRTSSSDKYRLISPPLRDFCVHSGAHGADDCRRVVRPNHGRPGHDHVGAGLKRNGKANFDFVYRGERQVSDWVGLNLICPVPPSDLPCSAWADGKAAEVGEQVGKMGKYPKSKSTQPSR